MNKNTLTIFFIAFLGLLNSFSPQGFAQDDGDCLSPPMNIPLVMSSSFCEPRPGHFHTGVDYKTQGRCGIGLLSVKAGELYRMKISPSGYGRVLYIRHYDSTMSVYAHMQSFRDDIEVFAENLQDENQSYFIDTVFEDAPFSFECGETIGYSGNTGHSFGPHLHFEIRKYPTEEALNAQNFFPVKDNVAPDFLSVVLYDMDQPCLSESSRSKPYRVTGSGSRYSRSEISVNAGKWGIGAEIKDRMTGTYNRYGVVEVKVYADDTLIYHSHIDKFDWNEADLYETWFDEYYLEAKGKYIQRCFAEGVNNSKMIQSFPETGIVSLDTGDCCNVRVVAGDAAGNESECKFVLSARGTKIQGEKKQIYTCDKPAFILGEGFYLEIPEQAMYRAASVEVHPLKRNGQVYSWQFADEYFVFYKPFKLSLDGSDIPWEYRDKALVMAERNGKHRRVAGEWNGVYYTLQTRFPGRFYFAIDSVPPALSGGLRDSVNLQSRSRITYRVSDNLSGVQSYNAWIDDEWVLLQYDPRTRKLEYIFDRHLNKNQWHHWKIKVTDAIGNVTEEEFVFYF